MVNKRTYIGFSIAGIILLCMYLQYTNFLYACVNIAIAYDAYYIYYKLNINRYTCLTFLVLMALFNRYLLYVYAHNPFFLLKICFVAQMSDVYQYIAGKTYGLNKIGWVSKNKSYEGYVGGYILTMLTFAPILWLIEGKFYAKLTECTWIYLLGVIGGLFSSLFKRYHGIKDYSDLLGDHGGWMDRIDSIVLPMLILY